MLKRDWVCQCRELLTSLAADDEQKAQSATEPSEQTVNIDPSASAERFDLITPRSRCPNCGHLISALENIPVISYLLLRGRCKGCATPISIRYPLIELLSALLSALMAWHFGFSWSLLGALVFVWALIALSFIDIDEQLLPDVITLPLLWLGLLLNLGGLYTNIYASVIGAAVGYLSLWAVYKVFKLITGKEGMGYGDFKLLAMFGAWMGWKPLLLIVMLSSLSGTVVQLSLMRFNLNKSGGPFSFGPYLALAGLICFLWGETIIAWYLGTMQ